MRQVETGGKQHEMPVQHKLNAFPGRIKSPRLEPTKTVKSTSTARLSHDPPARRGWCTLKNDACIAADRC
jgi:hypothetical protein